MYHVCVCASCAGKIIFSSPSSPPQRLSKSIENQLPKQNAFCSSRSFKQALRAILKTKSGVLTMPVSHSTCCTCNQQDIPEHRHCPLQKKGWGGGAAGGVHGNMVPAAATCWGIKYDLSAEATSNGVSQGSPPPFLPRTLRSATGAQPFVQQYPRPAQQLAHS